MNFRHIICLAAVFGVAFGVAAAAGGQWTAGMDDDAGKSAATSVTNLPAADYEGARKIYPKRDRLFTTSLDGTWAFKLVKGLDTPDEMKGWNEPGYDTRAWDDIAVPGNWETQGLKDPQYGNQIDEMSGFYVRRFRWNPSWEGPRVILRFDGVLFGYEVWLNGKYVGRWGSAYNLAQWDVTDKLVKGRNTIAVKVITRSRGWLFDTNDCWALAGIFRSVELFTVPNDYIEDIVFSVTGLTGFPGLKDEQSNPDNLVNPVKKQKRGSAAEISVSVDVGAFDAKASKAKKVYVSLVDDSGVHALDFERTIPDNPVNPVNPVKNISVSGVVPNAHLWSAEDPYLYTLVVTLVDAHGKKIERIAEPQGLRIVRLVDRHLEINGKQTFLNGVAWSEIDPVLGRAITEAERRKQMTLMKNDTTYNPERDMRSTGITWAFQGHILELRDLKKGNQDIIMSFIHDGNKLKVFAPYRVDRDSDDIVINDVDLLLPYGIGNTTAEYRITELSGSCMILEDDVWHLKFRKY